MRADIQFEYFSFSLLYFLIKLLKKAFFLNEILFKFYALQKICFYLKYKNAKISVYFLTNKRIAIKYFAPFILHDLYSEIFNKVNENNKSS